MVAYKSSPSSTRNITDIPQECLHAVFSLLGPVELAGLAVQGKYLRYVIDDFQLWEPHCLSRWPSVQAALYGGNFCHMYQARSSMPAAFPLAVDKVLALTADSKKALSEQQPGYGVALIQLAFEEVMSSLVTIGSAIGRDASLKGSKEFRALRREMAWWTREQPQALIAFARGAHESLQAGLGSWERGSSCWGSTAWRRTALAFLQGLGLLKGAHLSVTQRLQGEIKALDSAMRSSGDK